MSNAPPKEGFIGGDRALYIRLTDDGQFIRKWDRKPFEGGRTYYAEGVQPEWSELQARLAAVQAERDQAVAEAERLKETLRRIVEKSALAQEWIKMARLGIAIASSASVGTGEAS